MRECKACLAMACASLLMASNIIVAQFIWMKNGPVHIDSWKARREYGRSAIDTAKRLKPMRRW